MFIRLAGISKTYGKGDGTVQALRNISLDIERGESLAVVGASGSGKSTLLNILAGLMHPTAGSVTVDGIDLYGELDDDGLARYRSEYIGFVFQSFQLMPYLSALGNVMLPLVPLPLGRREKRDKAREVLARVGLDGRADHLPSELSGGQQQRVAIARALVNDPLILMADEPTGNLDSDTRDEILAIFDELNRMGHTLVMVTHDPANVSVSRRIVELADGRIADGRIAEGRATAPAL